MFTISCAVEVAGVYIDLQYHVQREFTYIYTNVKRCAKMVNMIKNK